MDKERERDAVIAVGHVISNSTFIPILIAARIPLGLSAIASWQTVDMFSDLVILVSCI